MENIELTDLGEGLHQRAHRLFHHGEERMVVGGAECDKPFEPSERMDNQVYLFCLEIGHQVRHIVQADDFEVTSRRDEVAEANQAILKEVDGMTIPRSAAVVKKHSNEGVDSSQFAPKIEAAYRKGMRVVQKIQASQDSNYNYVFKLDFEGDTLIKDLWSFGLSLFNAGYPFGKVCSSFPQKGDASDFLNERLSAHKEREWQQEAEEAVAVYDLVEWLKEDWLRLRELTLDLKTLYRACSNICADPLSRTFQNLHHAKLNGIDSLGDNYQEIVRNMLMLLNKMLRGLYAIVVMKKFLVDNMKREPH